MNKRTQTEGFFAKIWRRFFPQKSGIIICTNKKKGEKIDLTIEIPLGSDANVQIKGVKEMFRAWNSSSSSSYTLQSQTIKIRGDIETLICEDQSIEKIEFIGSLSLKKLRCKDNLLRTLSLKNISELKELDCSHNKLNAIHSLHSAKSSLERLNISNNAITRVSLQGMEELKHLNCSNNKLGFFKAKECSKLEFVYLENNSLKGNFHLSSPELRLLSVENNNIKALYIEDLVKLDTLLCSNNKLSALYLHKNYQLKVLKCNDNDLKKLLLFHNYLREVDCSKNPQLHSLDISKLKSLTDLSFDKKGITELLLHSSQKGKINMPKVDNLNFVFVDEKEDKEQKSTEGQSQKEEIAQEVRTFKPKRKEVQEQDGSEVKQAALGNKEQPNNETLEQEKLVAEYKDNNAPLVSEEAPFIQEKEDSQSLEDKEEKENAFVRIYLKDQVDKALFEAVGYSVEISGISAKVSQDKNLSKVKLAKYPIEDNVISISGMLQSLHFEGVSVAKIEFQGQNRLKELNLSKTSLQEIDLSDLDRLSDFHCINNNLESISFTEKQKMVMINLSNNNLSSIDIKNQSKLISLSVANNKLQELSLLEADLLKKLSCSSNQLERLDLSNCKNLKVLKANNCGLKELLFVSENSFRILSLTGNPDLHLPEEFLEQNPIVKKEFELQEEATEEEKILPVVTLKTARRKNQKIELLITAEDLSQCKFEGLLEEDFQESGIYTIKKEEIRIIGPISKLECKSSTLTEFVAERSTALKTLNLSRNRISNLVLDAPNLEMLVLVNNELETEGFSINSNSLKSLNMKKNKMKSLDLSSYSSLEKLVLDNNQVKELTLPKDGSNLKVISLNFNPIKNIDLTSFENLEVLSLKRTRVEEIDLSRLKDLVELNLSFTKITNLSLEGLQKIESLDLLNLKIKILDLSTCNKLKKLNISNAEIERLDLSGNEALQALYSYSPYLKELIIEENVELNVLHCAPDLFAQMPIIKNLQKLIFPNVIKDIDIINTVEGLKMLEALLPDRTGENLLLIISDIKEVKALEERDQIIEECAKKGWSIVFKKTKNIIAETKQEKE